MNRIISLRYFLILGKHVVKLVLSRYVLIQPLRPEERNLIDLELMIMEQVADWELDVGKVEAESS